MKLYYSIKIVCLAVAAISLCGCGVRQETQLELVEEAVPQEEAAVEEVVEKEPVAKVTKSTIPLEVFMQFALAGEAAAVLDALKNGVDANVVDEAGRTALMLAAFNGHTETVSALLKAGTKVDTRDVTGRTALMYTATGSNPEIVKTLIDHGAKVNVTDSGEKWTALMFAAAEGCEDVVRVLLDNGADPSAKDIDGDNAAAFARQRGHNSLAISLEEEV